MISGGFSSADSGVVSAFFEVAACSFFAPVVSIFSVGGVVAFFISFVVSAFSDVVTGSFFSSEVVSTAFVASVVSIFSVVVSSFAFFVVAGFSVVSFLS